MALLLAACSFGELDGPPLDEQPPPPPPPGPEPRTTLDVVPPAITSDPTARLEFACNLAGCTFQCDIDGAGYQPCTSPQTYAGLGDGGHTFNVRATAGGVVEATPRSASWTIQTRWEALHVAMGNGTGCGVASGGSLWCWGVDLLAPGGEAHIAPTPRLVEGIAEVASVVVSQDAVFVLGTDGRVRYSGQGAPGTSAVFADVPGLGEEVVAIAGSHSSFPQEQHLCAVTSVGAVKCVGANQYGQLGDGTTQRSVGAVVAAGITAGAVAVAAGDGFTCVLLEDQSVECWGRGDSGQIGARPSSGYRLAPITVFQPGSGVTGISAAWNHVCAVVPLVGAHCWGENARGELGKSPLTVYDSPSPVLVANSVDAVEVTAGREATCLRTSAGGVRCWGDALHGRLGVDPGTISFLYPPGGLPYVATPRDVQGLASGATSLSVGISTTCAIASGALYCWGNNEEGNLAIGEWGGIREALTPVVGFESGAAHVGIGREPGTHGCAARHDGTAWCWGTNDWGQLGDGSMVDSAAPVAVSGIPDGVLQIGAGWAHTCALTEVGSVYCWGSNLSRQLGAPTTGIGGLQNSFTPRRVNVPVAQQLTVGADHACVLAGGAVHCWGSTSLFQAGAVPSPHVMPGLESGMVQVAASPDFSCAVRATGEVLCWGWNTYGQLGNGTAVQSATPVPVMGITDGAIEVAVGETFACALVSGAVKCWGRDDGPLGRGTCSGTVRPFAEEVVGLPEPVQRVVAGSDHACAVSQSGTVACWGDGSGGELGDGVEALRCAPARSPALEGATQLWGGLLSTCGAFPDLGLACVGWNHDGMLGDGLAFSYAPRRAINTL